MVLTFTQLRWQLLIATLASVSDLVQNRAANLSPQYFPQDKIMQRHAWYGRDTGLQIRMAVTIFLLILTFLVFATVLAILTKFYLFLVIIPLIGLVVQYFASDKLVLASTGAKEVTPQQAPQLHAIVDRLSQLADLPKPRVAIMDSGMPNAFATGQIRNMPW